MTEAAAGRLKVLADAARDWAALLYTPVLTLYAAWLTAVIAWGDWSEAAEGRRLCLLGGALLASLALIGLGTLFYQRRPTPRIRAKGAVGEIEIGETGKDA